MGQLPIRGLPNPLPGGERRQQDYFRIVLKHWRCRKDSFADTLYTREIKESRYTRLASMAKSAHVILQTFSQSLTKFLTRYLERRFIRFVTITVLLVGLINLTIACLSIHEGRNAFGSDAGADYSCFYVAGRLLNNYDSTQLYNFELQSELYHSLLPGIPGMQELPFVNPPFFALPFRALSLLPYMTSYLTWIAISAFLYASGFVLIRKTLRDFPARDFSISLLLALSFFPFLLESTFGGNSSAFGFFSVALAIFFERRDRPLASGIALSLCFYKPTLLLLILPMLVVGRRFRSLAGVAIGGVALGMISILMVGWEASAGYLQTLFNLSLMASGEEAVFRSWKYVDILSFSRLLFGTDNALNITPAILSAILVMPFLIHAWWTLDNKDEEHRDLIWASTIGWTLVLNLHLGIYDSIIVVASMLLTAGVLYRRNESGVTAMPVTFRWLLVLLYVTPMFTQKIAQLIGFQPYTLILAAAATYPLYLLRGHTPTEFKAPARSTTAA